MPRLSYWMGDLYHMSNHYFGLLIVCAVILLLGIRI